MFKKVAILLTLTMLAGCETFEVNNKTNTTTVSWFVVDNVKQVCNELFKLHNIKQKLMVDGCAIWIEDFSICVIVTPKITTHEVVGHEIRHCFEGHFHD